MKKFVLTLIVTAAAATAALAQVGYWPQVGLTPRTPTIDVNTNYNNNDLETGDISITSNTNIVLAFEDDDGGILDFEACWTLFDINGNLLTPAVTITNIPGTPCFATAESITNCTYRSFFRSNGSPTPHYTADFGGKAKGSWYGDGFSFASSGGDLACEIPELANIALGQGNTVGEDFPAAQFLNNDGTRNVAMGGPTVAGLLTYSDTDCEPAGAIRIADVDLLSNGNIVLMGDDRQADDRVLTGQASGNLAVYKVLSSSGAVVKGLSAASSEPLSGGAWHGAAAISNGFALRFDAGGTKVRFFDNSGNPLGPNINVASVTCHPEAGGGGRGDGVGFKSNGKDAVAYACSTGVGPWLTVFNGDGTLRYSRKVADAADNPNSDRIDCAISADGRAVVVWDSSNNDTNNANVYRLVQARMFDACGGAIGPAFYLSERETATNAIAGNSRCRPRVAWRGNTIAFMWESDNSPVLAGKVLALRIFDAPPPVPCDAPLNATRIVPDTIVWYDTSAHRQKIGGYVDANAVAYGGSMEPYAGLLGQSVFLLGTDTYADDGTDSSMRSGLVFVPADGSTAKLGNGFYDDSGKAWTNKVNESRQDGNPNRVDGDRRVGATNFMAGMEASLYNYGASFSSDGRFNPSLAFYADLGSVSGRDACCQTFGLNTSTLAQTPLGKAQDSAYGRLYANTTPGTCSGSSADQRSRYGGHIVGLDNGNFVSVVEDRSCLFFPNGRASVATIFAPNGGIVKEAFVVQTNNDQWANVAAYQGGFSVRPSGGFIYFFNNAGTLQGSIDHNASTGLTYDTGRGDGTRTASDIRSKYVYMAGVANNNHVWLSVFDSQTRTFITKAIVDDTDSTLHGLDRVNLAVDANNNVCVVYKLEPVTVANGGQFSAFQVAARVMHFDGANITYVTPSFWPFINHDNVGDKFITTIEPSVAMTTSAIFISAKGVVNSANNPAAGGNTKPNTDLYTVIGNPAGQPTLTISQSGTDVIISWDAAFGQRCLQSTASISPPVTWTALNPQPAIVTAGGKNTMTVPIGAGNLFFRLAPLPY